MNAAYMEAHTYPYPYPAFIGGARVIERYGGPTLFGRLVGETIVPNDKTTPEEVLRSADEGKYVLVDEYFAGLRIFAREPQTIKQSIDEFKEKYLSGFDDKVLDQYEFVIDDERKRITMYLDLYFRKRPDDLLPERDTVVPEYVLTGVGYDGLEYERV